jgi:hypothetical protein
MASQAASPFGKHHHHNLVETITLIGERLRLLPQRHRLFIDGCLHRINRRRWLGLQLSGLVFGEVEEVGDFVLALAEREQLFGVVEGLAGLGGEV